MRSVLGFSAALVLLGLVSCTPSGGGSQKVIIALLPKLVNIEYFQACERGARRAAEELGVTLIYDGPREPDGAAQHQFIDTWIRQRVDAIAVAPNAPEAVKKFIQRAKDAGIKVLTWDTDSPGSARDLMVNQVDDETLAHTILDDLAGQIDGKGAWAIAIASLDATNLNNWRKLAEARAKEKYPEMVLVDTVVTNEDETVATRKLETLLSAHPDLKGILALDSNSVPGAAAAVVNRDRVGKVAIVGNTTPGKMRKYLKDGVLRSFYLWDPRELGALTVRCAAALVRGEKLSDAMELPGHGKLVFSKHDPSMVILSDPVKFTIENIDQYDFSK